MLSFKIPGTGFLHPMPALFLLWIASTGLNQAQEASISEQKITMKTYLFSDPDPVPDMEKNYPYFRFDGYTNKSTQQEWNMVVLENPYIKLYVCPDIGGKIWGAIEKSTGGEFLYFNDVVKFRDVAHRGPWTSGGIEFNFGVMSHVSTCSTPQDYVLKENDDGSVSCVIGAIDLHTRTKWNVEIRLPGDKAFVETTASWFNTHEVPVTFYHYMNAAAKTAGNLEFLYPGSYHIGHDGKGGEWPVENGIDISFYDNNDFGSYKSYHVINAYSNYFGGYWHEDDFGFGRLGHYEEMPGKKLWLWGLADEGEIWVDLLTDTKGQYIEFQSGKSFNQAMEGSSLTPFKHSEFIPFDADISKELWFPLKQTGGMVAASEYAVLNVQKIDGSVRILLSALQKIGSSLVVASGGKILGQEAVDLEPLELFTMDVRLDATRDFSVRLGDELLEYSSKREDLIVDRPVDPNPDFDWNSAIGLFTKGFELEKQQSYIPGGHAYRKAHDLYLKSLELDPAYAPALNRLAFSYYRRMEYQKALVCALRSLAIDTYDPEANYLFGLVNAKLGKSTNAKSGFSIAVQSTQYRNAAYTQLARLHLREKKFSKASAYALKALDFNRHNMVALEILALAQRQLGESAQAERTLEKIADLDATSAFVRYERIRPGKADKHSLQGLITNELPAESYLRLAIQYFHYGLPGESIEILRLSPEHALVYLWLAYLDPAEEQHWLEAGLEMPPDFVFPYRAETYAVLDHLMKKNDNWKLRYYAALVCWKKDLLEKAREFIEACGDEPEYVPFYLAKAKLFEQDREVKNAALARARAIQPENWRVNLALVEKHLVDGEFEQAAMLARESLKDYPERSVLGLHYATALLELEEYKKCISFLESYEVIPFEGAVRGRIIYREASIRESLAALRKNQYKKAIEYAQKATLWPRNLGSGKPYNADERLEDYIMAFSYEKLGRKTEADACFARVRDYRIQDHQQENAFLYLQVDALKNAGKQEAALRLIESARSKDPGNPYVAWVRSMESEEDPQAGIGKMIGNGSQTAPDRQLLWLDELLEILE